MRVCFVLAHLTAVSIPLLENVRMDGSVLGFTLLVAVATGLIFGLVPALQWGAPTESAPPRETLAPPHEESHRRPADSDAFLAATGAAAGIRMFTPSPSGRDSKGPGIAEAFAARL